MRSHPSNAFSTSAGRSDASSAVQCSSLVRPIRVALTLVTGAMASSGIRTSTLICELLSFTDHLDIDAPWSHEIGDAPLLRIQLARVALRRLLALVPHREVMDVAQRFRARRGPPRRTVDPDVVLAVADDDA